MFFSVIMPMYNVEPYLRQCIDSVLAQSFKDFELILVDDGSPDNCPVIADEYAAKDERIKVIHKQNGGLVSARQAGIEIAAGKYVINIDSDDWIEPDYFEKAYDIINKHNPDIVCFAVNFVTDGNAQKTPEIVPTGFYDREKIESEIIPNMLLTENMKHMHYYVWGKAFRKELIYPCQMAVDTRIAMGEDVSCLMPAYLSAQSVYISDAAIYDCRCHNSSMSRKFNGKHFEQIKLGIDLLKSKIPAAPPVFKTEIERYGAFMGFVLIATAAEFGGKGIADQINKLWCDEFTECAQNAQFSDITAKSKIAVNLLKKGKVKSAYRFLRLCAVLKGKV